MVVKKVNLNDLYKLLKLPVSFCLIVYVLHGRIYEIHTYQYLNNYCDMSQRIAAAKKAPALACSTVGIYLGCREVQP